MLLFFVIFFNKEMQVQPNIILALIAFSEFTEVTTFRMKEDFCVLRLPELWCYTVHFKITQQLYYDAIRTLTIWGGVFCGFGFRASLAFNLFLCIDIV
jgi:hypothetical protein